jgi:hypothetical protein
MTLDRVEAKLLELDGEVEVHIRRSAARMLNDGLSPGDIEGLIEIERNAYLQVRNLIRDEWEARLLRLAGRLN